MPPILAAAAITGVGAIYSSSQQSKAAKSAAQATQQASDASLALQKQQFGQATELNAPYVEAGNSALDALLGQFGLGGGAGAGGGAPDWNTYIAGNQDVLDAYKVMNGEQEGTPGQLAFIEGFKQSGLNNIGEYHNKVVGGREVPMIGGSAPAPANPTQSYGGTYSAPAPYVAPVRPTQAPLEIGLDKYTPSPDFKYQQDEGAKAINSGFGAKGLLQSGAAMKALQEFGQNLAMGDYGQWRDYTTGQYNNDRNVLNVNYENDRNSSQNQYNNDRGFGYNVFNDQRNYDTSRADNYTSNLFRITGLGQSSANQTSNAGQNYASNSGNILSGNAQQIGQSAYDRASANSDAAGAIAGAAGNVLKGVGTSYQSPANAMTAQFDPPVWMKANPPSLSLTGSGANNIFR